MRKQTLNIEDYGLLSDGRTAALVSNRGSVDWLCLPRFDSEACFAALVGNESHGCWQIEPQDSEYKVSRRYRDDSMVLETDYSTSSGTVRLTEALIVGEESPLLVRKVEGLSGQMAMRFRIIIRFDYGSIIPWTRKTDYGIRAVAGSSEVHVQAPFRLERKDDITNEVIFEIKEGETKEFCLSWHHFSVDPYFVKKDLSQKIENTDRHWRSFSGKCNYSGPHRDIVVRSILTLKSLIFHPTGGLIAAPTTSLPETLGGSRNWDYRYCWIRDSTFAMYALLSAGYLEEAKCWREWLLRAVAGMPNQANILYGVDGKRRLIELELDWLPGYENSRPVRIGNAAHEQLQLDIFGETIDTLHLALKSGLPIDENSWRIQRCFLEFLENNWMKKDEGIWETRGPRQHFTHSKVMAWVAFDRAIRSAEHSKLEGSLEKWKQLRQEIHNDICEKGFDKKLNSFTSHYGSGTPDASLLMMPIVGFLPPTDPRIIGTIDLIEKKLYDGQFVLRYLREEFDDNIREPEGCFLACSFWLADCWILSGQKEKAQELFERLLSVCNDLGLFSEEYNREKSRLVGNFPQALSHIALINTAYNLTKDKGPARDRSQS